MSLHEYHLRLLSITTVAQSILQEFLVNAAEELLAQSPTQSQPNISAVSTILSPYIQIFEKDPILKIPNNKRKVFDVKGSGSALSNPVVSTFDVSMICAILKRIPSFDTHVPDKANRCVTNSCIQKCCLQCNHKKVLCGNCSVTFAECRFKKNLCCSSCQTCGFCQCQNSSCDVFKLKKNLDVIRRARNIVAHGNWDEFIKLEKNRTPLEDFPKSNTWQALSMEINRAVSGILSYMENPQNYPSSKKMVSTKQKNDYEIEMKIACEGSSIIVERNFNGAVFKLVSQMLSESNEELDHLTDFLRNCIEKKLIDIHVMLTSHIDNFSKVDEQNEERYKEIESVLKANQKLLKTLNEKHAIDIETVKNDIKTQKGEQKKIIERIAVTEVMLCQELCCVKKDIQSHTEELAIVKERIEVTEADQLKLKEQVDVTEAGLVAQIKEHVKVKERIDVTEAEISTIKDKIGFSSFEMNQDSHSNQNSILDELIRDDGSSHSFQMRNSNWYLSCHHDEIDQPEALIDNFDRNIYAPGDKKVLKSYQFGSTKFDNEAGYAKYLIEKFDEQFGKDLIEQPWLLTNLHEDCVENRKFYQLCRDVNCFCQSKKYSLLLIDVSIEDNLKKLGFDIDKVKEQLNVHEAGDPVHRILVYIGESDVILNIRYVDSNDEKDISDAVRKSQNDTKLFCSLYKDVIQKRSISFVSMVVANISKKSLLGLSTCSECVSENLIVPRSGMCTTLINIVNKREESRINTSSSISTKHIFIHLASRLWGALSIRDVHLPNLCTDRDNALERIYLNGAQRRFLHSKKKHAILRGVFGSGKSVLAQEKFKYLIQNATETEDIFYLCFDDETLFKGVLEKQISSTVNHQLRPEQIYIMTSDEYSKQFGLLPPVMFSEILQDINERYKQTARKPQIIADEFDSNNLTSKEAKNINDILPEFKDSYVLLIPQSLETVRKRITSQRLRNQEEKYAGQEFERTGMAITMLDSIMRNTTKINELSQVTIRELEKHKSKIYVSDTPVPEYAAHIESNTTDIQSVNIEHSVKITKEPKLPKSSINNTNDSEENIEMVTTDTEGKFNTTLPAIQGLVESYHNRAKSDVTSSLSTSHIFDEKDLNITHTSDVRIDYLANKSTTSKYRNTMNNSNMNEIAMNPKRIEKSFDKSMEQKKVDSQSMQKINSRKEQQFKVDSNSIPVYFYHVLKKMDTSIEKSTSRAIESQFRFPGKGNHGHKVMGKIPALINPFKNIEVKYDTMSETEIKMRLLFSLQNIINVREKSRGMAIIVFEPIEAQIFHAILLSMDIDTIVYTPAISTGLTQTSTDDMVNKLKDHVLVTDHVGARGLEFKQLIVTENPNEIFLYQHLVEAFTRCLYGLSFIVFNTGVKEKGTFSTGNIIKIWEKNNLVQKYEIEVCELHEEDSEYLDLYCKKMNRCYHIHTWHKDLRPATTIDPIKQFRENDELLRVQYNLLLSHAYLEEEVTRKQDKQVFSKECTRRGYKTYKDIILGNDKEIVDMLLKVKDRSYMTNFRDFEGNSLLDLAFLHGCADSTEVLVQFGLECSLNCEKLVAQNDKLIVDLLVKFKSNPLLDYRDINGNTLMHIASENEWFHFVEAMSYSILRNIKNNDNKVPLDLAQNTGNKSIINLLTKKIDSERIVKEYDGARYKSNYLEKLVEKNSKDELNVLLSNRDLTSQHGWTLLYNAARRHNIYLFQLFIQYGCQIDFDLYHTAYGTNGTSGSVEVMKFIVDKYPHIMNLKDKYGDTVLHHAAGYDCVEVVKLIFKKYSRLVGAKNNNGSTSLYYAAYNGSWNVVKLFLDKYPHITGVKNKDGDTALHHAAYNDKVEVVKLILKTNPHLVNSKDNDGDTALHDAARRGKDTVVMFFLGYHPHIVEVKNNKGRTAYSEAVYRKKTNVVNLMDAWYKILNEHETKTAQ